MTQYDDAAFEYDDATLLYDGLVIDDAFALVVNGVDLSDYLADRSLAVKVGTHGNALGTLDATFNNPPSNPDTEQEVRLYVNLIRLFDGDTKDIEISEYWGANTFARISAQDAGWDGSLPVAAPFNLSDDPDGAATFAYDKLTVKTRTTEGGAAKTTAEAHISIDGLWAGQNVEVTSENHGLAAEEFTIIDASVSWQNQDTPKYVLTLGEPLVSLAFLMLNMEVADESITTEKLAAGAVTATKITDGSITTPKIAANAVTAGKIEALTITAAQLAADAITSAKIQADAVTTAKLAAGAITTAKLAAGAVTADEIAAGSITSAKFSATAEAPEVRNSTSEVGISPTGISVINGKITVTNAGAVVVIDGSSNMFKIVATGTINLTGPTAGATVTNSLDIATGFTYPPANLGFYSSIGTTARNLPAILNNAATGASVDWTHQRCTVVATNQTRVTFESSSTLDRSGSTYTDRYYVLKEAAI